MIKKYTVNEKGGNKTYRIVIPILGHHHHPNFSYDILSVVIIKEHGGKEGIYDVTEEFKSIIGPNQDFHGQHLTLK